MGFRIRHVDLRCASYDSLRAGEYIRILLSFYCEVLQGNVAKYSTGCLKCLLQTGPKTFVDFCKVLLLRTGF